MKKSHRTMTARRALCLLMALTMLFTLFSTAVLATGEESHPSADVYMPSGETEVLEFDDPTPYENESVIWDEAVYAELEEEFTDYSVDDNSADDNSADGNSAGDNSADDNSADDGSADEAGELEELPIDAIAEEYLFEVVPFLGADILVPAPLIPHDVVVTDHASLAAAISTAPTDGTERVIAIQGDFALTDQINIVDGQNIHVISYGTGAGGNRYTLTSTCEATAPNSAQTRHFRAWNNTRLSLTNIVLDGGHTAGNTYRRGGVRFDINEAEAHFAMGANAVIQNCVNGTHGGGVAAFTGSYGIGYGAFHVHMSANAQIRHNHLTDGHMYGGGIAFHDVSFMQNYGVGSDSMVHIHMQDSASVHNNSGGLGGGILASSTTFSIHMQDMAEVHDNYAATLHGGISAMRSATPGIQGPGTHFTIEMRDTARVHNNTSGGDGGGIGNHMGIATILHMYDNTSIHDNTTTSGSGGGLSSIAGQTLVNMHDNARIHANTTSGDGGAMRIWGTNKLINLYDDVRIHDNQSLSGSGGGIFTMGINSTLRMHDNVRVHNNTANSRGGGVALTTGTSSYLYLYDDARIHNNTTTVGSGGGAYLWGDGHIYMRDRARIHHNTSAGRAGGVLLTARTAWLHMYDVTEIDNNEANNGAGGGVYFDNRGLAYALHRGVVMNDDTQIHNNEASGNGGGVHGSVTMRNNARIHNNIAGDSGGGGQGVNGIEHLTMYDDTAIYDNTATRYGGGWRGANVIMRNNARIHNNDASSGGGLRVNLNQVYMHNNARIDNNTAAANGGGIMGAPRLRMHDTARIHHNTAGLDGGGWALYNFGSAIEPVMMASFSQSVGRIHDNQAGRNGGGIMIFQPGTATVHHNLTIPSGVIIEGNSATGRGGGVYVGWAPVPATGIGGVLTLSGGTIRDNTALYGGGVYLRGTPTTGAWAASNHLQALNLLGGTITDNHATNDGGGVYVASRARLLVLSGGPTISENIAGRMGGGIFTERYCYNSPIVSATAYTNLNLTGVNFIGNEASFASPPPSNALARVPATGFNSTSFSTHPLNNYDINFRSPLVLTKTATPASVAVGGTITYTITIRNDLTAAQGPYVVRDVLSSHVTFNPASLSLPAGASHNFNDLTNTLTVTMPTVPATGTSVITFQVTVDTIPTDFVIANTAVLRDSDDNIVGESSVQTPIIRHEVRYEFTVGSPVPDSFTPNPIPPTQEVAQTQTVTVAPPLTSTSPGPGGARGSWSFSGWNTTSPGGPAPGETTFTMPGNDVVFTGTWTFTENATTIVKSAYVHSPDGPGAHTVIFDTQGGAPVPPNQTVPHAQTATTPPAPTRAGYNFRGWFLTPTGGAQVILANWPIVEDITFYAQWQSGPGGGPVPISAFMLLSGGTQPTAGVGDTITYTIVVENPSANASDFVVVDRLNTNFVELDETSIRINNVLTNNFTFVDGELRVNVTIPAGARVAVTFEVTVLEAAAGNVILNVAILERDGEEIIETPPVPVVVPGIEKTSSIQGSGVVEIGTYVEYTFTVTNPGDDVLMGYTVVDTLPAELELVGSATVSPASALYDDQTADNEVRLVLNLPSGETVITITARIIAASSPSDPTDIRITNTVRLYGPGGRERDRDQETVARMTVVKSAYIHGPDGPGSHTVTFNPNGGTPLQTQQVAHGLTVDESLLVEPTFPAPDELFLGWALEPLPSGLDPLVNLADWPIVEDITFYAQWQNMPDGGLGAEPISEFVSLAGGTQSTAGVGDTITYTIVVGNPGVSASDFVVVDRLNTNFVRLNEASIRINNVLTNDFTFIGGELRVNITVPAGGRVAVTFEVTVLRAAAGNVIFNVAILERDGEEIVETPPVPVVVPGIEKTSSIQGNGALEVGTYIEYTFTVTNPSDYVLVGYTVVDTLPAELVLVGNATVDPASALYDDQTANNEVRLVLNLPSGETVITITARVVGSSSTSDEISSITNTVRLYGPDGRERDRDREIVTPMTIVKSARVHSPNGTSGGTQSTAGVGDTIVYTITVGNPGASASEFVVVDRLNTDFVELDETSIRINNVLTNNFTFADGELRVNINVPAGTRVTVTFEVTVLEAATGNVIFNVAILEGEGEEIIETPPVPVVVPGIEKTSSIQGSGVVEIGTYVEYTFTVTNPGDDVLMGYTVVDTLPAELELVSSATVSPASALYDDQTADNEVRLVLNLPSGETVITITARIVGSSSPDDPSDISITNTVRLYGPDGRERDRDQETVTPMTIVKSAQIHSPDGTLGGTQSTAGVGDTITYTITVGNPSASASDFVVVDRLNTNFVELDRASVRINNVLTNNFTFVDGELRVNITVPARGSVTVTFEVTVLRAAAGNVVLNVAILERDGEEIVETPPVPVVVPGIEKTSSIQGDGVLEVGAYVEYTITVTNPGDDVLTGYTVVDTLPAELMLVGIVIVSPASALYENQTANNEVRLVLNLPSGETVITITARVVGPSSASESEEIGSITNTVRLYGPDGRERDRDQETVYPPLVDADSWRQAFLIGRDVQEGQPRPIAPRSFITRAEAATIFFRMVTDEVRAEYWMQDHPFDDVSINQWFNNAIATTRNMGIVRGVSENRFAPRQNITRGELTAMMVRFMQKDQIGPYGLQVSSTDYFSDIANHWARDYINEAARQGWVRGYDNGTFRPSQAITRAETMAMINRMFGRLVESTDCLLDDMVSWHDNPNPRSWYYLYVYMATNSFTYRWRDNGYMELIDVIAPRAWERLERPHSTRAHNFNWPNE